MVDFFDVDLRFSFLKLFELFYNFAFQCFIVFDLFATLLFGHFFEQWPLLVSTCY